MSFKRFWIALLIFGAVGALAWPNISDSFDPDSPINLSMVERQLISKIESLPTGHYLPAVLFGDDWQRICFGGVDRRDDPALQVALKNWRFENEYNDRSGRGLIIVTGKNGAVTPIVFPHIGVTGNSTYNCFSAPSFGLEIKRLPFSPYTPYLETTRPRP